MRADFDGDGAADLAIGPPGEGLGAGQGAAGVVHVLYGSAAGLTGTGSQLWSQDTPGVTGVAEAGDGFGGALAGGDFNGDGRGDLAVGAGQENQGRSVVHVLVGAPAGLTAAGSQLWSQDSPGVADQAEGSDQLGSALATGDFNGDGPAELAMGTPGENLNRGFGSGVVHVLPGSGAGLTAAGSQLWSQDSPGVAGAPEFLDFFGQALAASIPSGADGTPVMGRQLAPSHADRHPSNDSDPAPAPLTHAVCGLPALATRRPAITGHPSLAVLRRTHPAGSEDVLLARRRAVNPPIASSLQLLYACSRSAACWGQANKAA